MTPSVAHLQAFGALVHHYATVETGLKIALCGMLRIDLSDALIISQPYGAVDLRHVVKAVAKEREWKDPVHLEQLVQIVGDIKPFGPLRNHIAHSRWTAGSRPGAIRPRHINIRNEKAEYFGDGPSERDWTAPEIAEAANALAQINGRILSWLVSTGLQEIIERNTLPTNAAISS